MQENHQQYQTPINFFDDNYLRNPKTIKNNQKPYMESKK